MLYSSLRSRLKDQHTALKELIKGLSSERLTANPEPGKWSIHDNIVHLATYQLIFINRINLILKTDNPVFGAYKADDDELFLAWQAWNQEDQFNRLYTDREQIYQLITSFGEAQLALTGTHLTYGQLNIVQWTEFFVLHEAHHLFTILKLARGM